MFLTELVSATEFNDVKSSINLRHQASIFTDINGQYQNINDLFQATPPFINLAAKTPSIFGVKHWLKIDLSNPIDRNMVWMLKLGYPGITYLDAYWIKGNSIIKIIHLDQYSHFTDRPVNDPLIFLELNFSPKEQKSLYLYYQTIGDVPLSLKLENIETFEENQEFRLILNSLLLGFLFAILMVITVNTVLNYNRTNLFYACFTLSVIFIISDICGYNYKFLWPNISGLAENIIGKFFILLPCLQLLFIKSFLDISSHHQKLNKVYNGFIIIYWLLLALSFFLNIIHLALVLGVLLAPVIIYTAIWSFSQKIAAVKIFSLSLISHVVFINILTILGSLHGPIFADIEISTAIKMGYFIEAILFTTALAWQTKVIQKNYFSKFDEKIRQQFINQQHSNRTLENKLYEKLNSERNALLASISHELRTPLTVMQMDVESLQYNVADNVHETYADLKHKIQDIDQLISNFNQITCDAPSENSSIKQHNVKYLFKSLLDQFVDVNNEKRINLQENIDVSETIEIAVDSETMAQLVNCLLNNSIQFSTPPLLINFSISEVMHQEKSAIKITVEDSAPNVSNKHLENIFMPLFRVEKSRSKVGGGTGMGLAICKDIVAKLNGEIWGSQSKLGGLAITILIPATKS